MAAALVLHEDLGPSPAWLEQLRLTMEGFGVRESGAPKYFGPCTAEFSRPVRLSVRHLIQLPGLNGEFLRGEHRKASIDFLMKDPRRLLDPIYIEVDQYGKPWVSEGNHRIAVAFRLALASLEVQIKYFTGGQLVPGILSPGNVRLMEGYIGRRHLLG